MAPIVFGISLAFAADTPDYRRSLVYSFTDSHYLIQVDDTVFQIKRLGLAPNETIDLAKIILFGHVNLTAPKVNAQLEKRSSRSIASAEFLDSVSIDNNYLSIAGTMLYSGGNQPIVIMKSNAYIYQVKRDRLATATPELLNLPQSKMQLVIPIIDVEYIWTTNYVKTVKLEDEK